MTTSRLQQVSLVVATTALLIGSSACGSDASDMAPGATRDRSASVPSMAPALQRAALDPAPLARAPQRTPEDPPPPRPSTKEACDTCHGLWGVHGIDPVDSCICKTNDQGRDCRDGNQCQGECLLDDDAEFHVMDQGDPTRGYYEGRCADHDTTFGCFRHVPDGIERELPLTAEEAGPYICVD